MPSMTESSAAGFPVSTGFALPGMTVEKDLGVAFGLVVRSMGVVKSLGAGFKAMRQGEVTHSVMVRVNDAHAHCEQARAHGARILMEPTDFEYGVGSICYERMHACDWRNFARDKAETTAALQAAKPVIYPFVNVALSDSMAEQLQCARILAAHDAPASPTPLWRGMSAPGRSSQRRRGAREAYARNQHHSTDYASH
jgi:hypothetical protein